MDTIIAAAEQRRARADARWRLPSELLYLIMQVLLDRYHAFSDADRSIPGGPADQAASAVMSLYFTRSQWLHQFIDSIDVAQAQEVEGDLVECMYDQIHDVITARRGVLRWSRVADALYAVVNMASDGRTPKLSDHALPVGLRCRVMELADLLTVEVERQH